MNGEFFEKRKVHVLNPRPTNHIAALVAKLSRLRNGIQLLEYPAADPLVRRTRSGIGISNQIRAT